MTTTDISTGARLVYWLLDDYARGNDMAWPSQATIAGRLGMDQRTVRRHIAALTRNGMIEKHRKNATCGRNEYKLLRTELSGAVRTDDAPLRTDLACPLRTELSYPLPLNEATHCEPLNTGKIAAPRNTPENNQTPSQEEIGELAEGFDRHLKHHRSEPRDLVMQTLMGMRLNWELFRGRHEAYCERMAAMGWQYCTLTFLGWIRAGYPPAPPVPINGKTREQRIYEEMMRD